MIEFGYTLRKAREDKGLTIAQVSEITRMLPQQIEDLENENFSRIAAPIYGRGFVKLFCEAVDLEPKPLVEEFMEIYNGNRQPAIRARRAVEPPTPPAAPTTPSYDDTEVTMDSPLAPPPPPPPPSQQPAEMAGSRQATHSFQEESPAPSDNDDAATTFFSAPQEEEGETLQENNEEEPFRLEGETLPTAFMDAPPATPAGNLSPETPAPAQEDEELGSAVRFAELVNRANAAQTPPKPRGASRYAAPAPIDIDSSRNSGFSVNPTVWRFATLAVVACLVLWGVWSLASKVWNAATNAPQTDIPGVSETSPTALPGAPEPQPRTAPAQPIAQETPAASRRKREPIKIPPLYID